MAREYPRFIFSDPQNTKSKGPFIVHTLSPQMIAKVTYAPDGGHYVDALKVFTESDEQTINEVVYRMHDWYTHNRMKEAKLSDDFYIRTSDIMRRISELDYFSDGIVSISMVFKPVMGAKLDISKDNWKVSVDFDDDDNYESTIHKLKNEYERKYLLSPYWPI